MIYGDRVKEARELRGFTQTQLAELTGVSQGAIAHVEAGRTQPSPALLESLAQHLGFPKSFFADGSSVDFPEGSLLFRARASMTARERAQAHRYGQLIYRKTRPLLEGLKLPPITLPRLSDASPEMAAAHTRAALGLSPDAPIPHLINAAERAGVLTLAIPIGLEKRDAYSLFVGDDSLKPVIVVTSGVPGDRLRFNVAHELGHLVMRHGTAARDKEIEDQADAFAGFLLLPRAAMEREMLSPVTLTSLARMKPRWGVSIQALVRQAKRLELLSEYQYKYMSEQIGKRGWRIQEPENLAVPVEKPRAVRKILEGAFGIPIDYRRAGEALSLYPHFLRNLIEVYASRRELPKGGAITGNKVVPFRKPDAATAD
jgi:Zn-dependent peptidase ImmA (M78 family)/transcriptional regulator with XRE-family HTH domain